MCFIKFDAVGSCKKEGRSRAVPLTCLFGFFCKRHKDKMQSFPCCLFTKLHGPYQQSSGAPRIHFYPQARLSLREASPFLQIRNGVINWIGLPGSHRMTASQRSYSNLMKLYQELYPLDLELSPSLLIPWKINLDESVHMTHSKQYWTFL